MNRNDFETWMKNKIEEEQYTPTEDLWNKLNKDLQAPAPEQKKIFFVPWMKIAATLTLIISLGSATYFLLKDKNENLDNPKTNTIATNTENKKAPSEDIEKEENPNIVPLGNNVTNQFANNAKATANNTLKATTIAAIDTNNILPKPPEKQHHEGIAQPPTQLVKENKNKQDIKLDPYPTYNYIKENNQERQGGFNMGIAANVGKPSVGSVGYQLGLVGRADISKTVFAEATIAMASTSVNYSQGHSFPGMTSSNDGLTSNVREEVKVNAIYARNIISVGVNPSIGIKIGKKLSVSGGGAVYRNLNPELSLTNKNEIESAALTNGIISTSEKVSNWDIGITSNADYKITKQLSFNANYRQGLSNYLHYNNKYHKNSGFNLGLRYIFGK